MADIKPIRSQGDYERAMAEVERLWGASAGTAKGDRLDVLATLIDAYEREHFPIEAPTPVEAIKFRMEQAGLSPKDLVPAIGRLNRVYEILNRKRPLTLNMIWKLHEKFGIPAESLIRPVKLSLAA